MKKDQIEARRISALARVDLLPAVFLPTEPNGEVEVVPGEAAIVKLVFDRFAEGRSAQEIKRELDQKDLRNRAGYRWTTAEIAGLVRPVFAGLVPQRLGFKRSAVYEPIVTRDLFAAARAALRRDVVVENAASRTALGGRDWAERRLCRERMRHPAFREFFEDRGQGCHPCRECSRRIRFD